MRTAHVYRLAGIIDLLEYHRPGSVAVLTFNIMDKLYSSLHAPESGPLWHAC